MLYFNYCSAVWGDINIKKLADKLQKMQNRAARILTFSSYDVRSSVLLDDELGSERLENVILKQLAVIMYKIPNDLFSSYLRRVFTSTSNIHTQSSKFRVKIIMFPDPELSLRKGAYTTEDLFCGTGFPQRLENCLS